MSGNPKNGNAQGWPCRAEFWQCDSKNSLIRTSKSAGIRQPLILSGHGMRLQINHGTLEVQNGFTHYPQRRETWRFFPGDALAPSRIVLLDGSGAITLDVISWLSVQNIPLIQIDYRGKVVAVIGSNGIGADPDLVRLQQDSAQHPKRSMIVATWLVREKLIASRRTLETLAEDGASKDKAIDRIDADIIRLSRPWTGEKVALLGVEGKCAQVYFNALRDIPIAWKGTGRKPIPETWHRIGPRNSRKTAGSRFSTHPVQAMLNYAYAVLESQLRMETVKIGLDQGTGFLHHTQADRPALVMDLLEPLRPVVDRIVFTFVQNQIFAPADFTLASDGTCRLHPQLARRVVAEIGQVEGIDLVLSGLLKQLGYKKTLAIPDRIKAWSAQKALPDHGRKRTC